MKQLRKLIRLPVYPLFLAAYPPLALLLANMSEVQISAVSRSAIVSISLSLVFFLLFRFLFNHWHRAAFVLSTVILLFYSFGHVYNILDKEFEALPLDPWLGVIWGVLLIISLLFAGRKKARYERITPGLNVVSLGLVLFILSQIIWFGIPRNNNQPAAEFAPIKELYIAGNEVPPDIYYIIIDSYGRSDLLKNAFDYDNNQFLENLQSKGFFIAECAQSNYNRTDVSLASSLNLDYLQNLSEAFEPPSKSRRILWSSIDNNAVKMMLDGVGYTSIAFSTGFAWSEIDSSDVFLAPSSFSLSLSSFEVLLLRTTPARYLETTGLINLTELDGMHFRERTQYIFDSFEVLVKQDGPKFIFIHILPPHPPFVYAPDGSYTDPATFLNEDQRYTSVSYISGYRNQIEYISEQIEKAVQTILNGSNSAPIIILQGDHAPWLQTGTGKFKILNAYYLPGHNDLLYPTISPVNTFRLIFNTYFGTDYDLLPDTSYYSPIPSIYEFEEFPNPCLER